MLRLGRNGEEAAAPVGCAAGEDVGEVPASGGVSAAGLNLALHHTEHPRRADEGRERAVGERLAPAPVPRGLVVGEAGLRAVGQQGEQRLHLVVALDVELAILGVVALVELVDHGVPHKTAVVVPGLAGGFVVLGANLEVLFPGGVVAAEQCDDFFAVARQASFGEQRRVVAEALRSDVGAVPDDAAVGVGALRELVVGEGRCDLFAVVIVEVNELVGDLHNRAEPALFDGLNVGEAGAGCELGECISAGVVTRVDVGGLDGNTRMGFFVLGVEIAQAHGAEGGDGEGDVTALARIGPAGTAGGDERQDGCTGYC